MSSGLAAEIVFVVEQHLTGPRSTITNNGPRSLESRGFSDRRRTQQLKIHVSAFTSSGFFCRLLIPQMSHPAVLANGDLCG
ncbi:hypothetical protein [Glutamicibacter protophormiae]|uniref:hypothetical protein n=1 Tax=Glutamicibacter protophormiae TaxID=37930 RepID=UPI003317F847